MKKLFVSFVVVAAVLLPATAFAGNDSRVVEFEALEGTLEQDRLELAYEIDRRSWRVLERRNVQARLNLFIQREGHYDSTFVYSVELAHREGHFTYPRSVRVSNGDRISFELVGYAGSYRVEGMRFGGKRYTTVAFDIYSDCTNLPGTRRRARDDHDRDYDRRRRDYDRHGDCRHDRDD